ncbi:MAG: hypothetical protein CMJ75_14580 [Planctomycetaceae bacterium]|nr:hypothetical protein [Planctomycetaceae bacterium]
MSYVRTIAAIGAIWSTRRKTRQTGRECKQVLGKWPDDTNCAKLFQISDGTNSGLILMVS